MASNPLSPEFAVLCRLTGTAGAGPAPAWQDVDWREIVTLAARHRVEGAVAQHIVSEKLPVPESVAAHFEACRRRDTIAALQAGAGINDIARAFAQQGIPYVLLKGLAISERYYAVRAERQSIDIDIMIDEADIDRALEALGNAGFNQSCPPPLPSNCETLVRYVRKDTMLVRASDGLSVEMHWRLSRNPHLLPWSFRDVLAFSERLSIFGTEHRVLRPAPLFVYLACHGTMHRWFRLKWLTDIERMLTTMDRADFDTAFDLARRYGCARIFATTVTLARQLYGCPAPSHQTQIDRAADPRLLRSILPAMASPDVPNEDAPLSLRDYLRQLGYELALRSDLAYRATAFRTRMISYDDVSYLQLSERWYYLYLVAGPLIGLGRAIGRSTRGRRVL